MSTEIIRDLRVQTEGRLRGGERERKGKRGERKEREGREQYHYVTNEQSHAWMYSIITFFTNLHS